MRVITFPIQARAGVRLPLYQVKGDIYARGRRSNPQHVAFVGTYDAASEKFTVSTELTRILDGCPIDENLGATFERLTRD